MESSTLDSHPKPSASNVFTHESPFPIYALASSSSSSASPRLAIGSFLEEYTNKVDIVAFDEETHNFHSNPSLSFDHPYPPTKLMFHPTSSKSPDLLASSGDFLRLWEIHPNNTVEPRAVLNNSKTSEFCAPLTSFDWNEAEPRRIGTSSIDTTCTIWDIERGAVETQLIAHDKEVYDIAWGEAGVFASVSADGSVRIFDLRDKEHSTIIYESPQPDTPLLRLAWNKQDLRYMATILMDNNKIQAGLIPSWHTRPAPRLISYSGRQRNRIGLRLPSETRFSFLKSETVDAVLVIVMRTVQLFSFDFSSSEAMKDMRHINVDSS
ncbi:hypothetical protein H6P81_008359 [Aristolochia fimbriata]|uniref:Uncharacterized protein n=1 Tax=Aristolochia fimbriata TaxID=158543 RepID=A0AAV7F553_ARIFI|nr:hypothetical protein H6P81_008359 [Aristolochia fimbriata]